MTGSDAPDQQPPAAPQGDGGHNTTSQGTPAAPVASTQTATTSGGVQSVSGDAGGPSASTSDATSTATVVSAPAALSGSMQMILASSSDATATPSIAPVPPVLPAAGSTPLVTSSAPAPTAAIPALLQQLHPASSSSSQASPLSSGAMTASASSYTPPLYSTIRPTPALSSGAVPAPAFAQVPASIYDVRRGEHLLGMVDGLARSVPVPRFSDAELRRLSAIGGGNASNEVLQATPLHPLDFSDARVRIAAEREAVALAQCYGVEELALRSVATAHYLQQTIRYIQTMEQQLPASADARASISRLRTECDGLVTALTQEREGHARTAQLLQDQQRAQVQPSVPTADSAEVKRLQSEVNELKAVAGRLSSEKSDLQDQLQTAQDEITELCQKHDYSEKRIADLEGEIIQANFFSPDKLMDFLAQNTSLGGNWKRLQELFKIFKAGTAVAPELRTSVQVVARDQVSDDCGPYVSQGATNAPASSSTSRASAHASPSPTQRLKSSRTRIPLGSSQRQSKSPQKAPRKSRRLSLTGSPSSGSPSVPVGAGGSSQPQPIDLTGSTPSTPRTLQVMLLADRMKLPSRPSVHPPQKLPALKQSQNKVSDFYARRAVPAPYSWDWTRADVMEFLFIGCSFWDAVAEVQKQQVLHDQFGKQALIGMLVSAMYWKGLDRTPWMSYVPDKYFEAAWKVLRDPAMAEIPEPWEPLPVKPVPGSPDSSLEWLHSSDDEVEDDKHDKTYHAKGSKSSSTSSTRAGSASGKRSRGSTSSGKGSASKVAKMSAKGTAGASSRSKPSMPPPLPDDGIIEAPRANDTWRHYGIKVQGLPRQTVGFPSYMPVQPLLQHLHVRWLPIEYCILLDMKPWDIMWQNRVQSLIFFTYNDMTIQMGIALKIILNFMSRWRREYWERYHWVTPDPKYDYYRTAELRSIPGLVDMYRDRKDRHSDFDSHRKKMMAEVEGTPGYDEKIWYEPGLWVIPQNPCYWITRDPKLNIPLRDQLQTVDELEPARTQWATRRSDDAFLNFAPAELNDQILDDVERANNLLIPEPKFNHDTLARVMQELKEQKG